MALATSAPDSLWAPLAHRNFRLLWVGFVTSQAGDIIQMLAQAWLVVELTGSAARLGLLAAAQALPRLLLGLFAGVLVDRVDRRRLLLATQSLAALQSGVFLALQLTQRITYASLLALALALGVLDALNLTARAALMPTLVPRPMIPRAVALQALGVNVTQLAGPSLGGVLLASVGVEGCLVANLVSFSALVLSLLAMRLPAREAGAGDGGSVGDALREGLGYLRAHPALRASIALAYLLGVFGMPLVRLLPLYARVVLDTSPRGYGALAAASGVGALLASLLVTARSSRATVPRNIVVSGVLFSVAVIAFGYTRHPLADAACLVGFGGSQMAFRSAVMTRIQSEVPDRLRGRVVSVLAMDFALWSLGAAAIGAAVDAVARARAGLGPGAPIPRIAMTPALTLGFTVAGVVCLAAALGSARRVGSVDPAPPAGE
jgi:MFS family permease